MYPPLPTPDAPQQGQTPEEYAAVLLRFVLSTGATPMLTDAQLEAAWHASQRAITARNVDPVAVAALYQARQLIILTRTHRAQRASTEAQTAPPTAPAPRPDVNGGYASRLQPPLPTRPPGGSYADARVSQLAVPVGGDF